MSNYSIASHTLAFADNYCTIRVSSGTETVADYDLTGEDAIRLRVVDGNYSFSTAEKTAPPDLPDAAFDTAPQPALVFDGSRLTGGEVIIDIRDIGRKMRPTIDPGTVNANFDFDLEGADIDFWNEGSWFALKIVVGDAACCTINILESEEE